MTHRERSRIGLRSLRAPAAASGARSRPSSRGGVRQSVSWAAAPLLSSESRGSYPRGTTLCSRSTSPTTPRFADWCARPSGSSAVSICSSTATGFTGSARSPMRPCATSISSGRRTSVGHSSSPSSSSRRYERRAGRSPSSNSTVGLDTRAGVGQFASTQHALRALADTLRLELNDDGIRVLSVYPGRTATERQRRIFRDEARAYAPEHAAAAGGRRDDPRRVARPAADCGGDGRSGTAGYQTTAT